jgi:hypothetical protein
LFIGIFEETAETEAALQVFAMNISHCLRHFGTCFSVGVLYCLTAFCLLGFGLSVFQWPLIKLAKWG